MLRELVLIVLLFVLPTGCLGDSPLDDARKDVALKDYLTFYPEAENASVSKIGFFGTHKVTGYINESKVEILYKFHENEATLLKRQLGINNEIVVDWTPIIPFDSREIIQRFQEGD